MENEDIRNRIFEGLRSVFEFYDAANLEREHCIKPEYLLTVKIAESLFKNNTAIKIKLEESTSDFANSCFNRTELWHKPLSYNTKRNGKIDIAVYSSENESGYYPYKSLFPVEIKNINPSKFDLLLDVERNLELIELSDSDLGKSVVDKAFNVSIEEIINVYNEELDSEIESRKAKYKKWLSNSGLFTKKTKYEVFTKHLDNDCSISKSDRYENGEYLENYHRIGFIIEITSV